MTARPEQIYLDEPIMMQGIKVGHTHEGAKYLIEHYTHMMETALPTQMDGPTKLHFQNMLINLALHVTLYEQTANKTVAAQ